MNKIKLAHFDDPKWTYKQLCAYAYIYRSKLNSIMRDRARVNSMTLKERLKLRDAILALRAYNSKPRKELIEGLKVAQTYLYK